MITKKCRGAISNREIESHIRREQPTITPHKRYCGLSQNRFFFGEEYKQYLTFSVEIITNTLISAYNENVWNDEKERMHERIKSLHDSGKGYRTIPKLLNAEGSRTAKNKEWKNTNVYAVLKRYAERQARLERQSYTSEMKFSKMKLEWLKY